MRTLTITPQKLQGTVAIPPSKSMAHRAIICAALAKGISKISHIDYSDDMIATIEGMRALGAQITEVPDGLEIDGTHTLTAPKSLIDCNESGSTLRFLVPLSIANHREVKFIGRGNLGKRPLDVFYRIFDDQGIKYTYTEGVMDLEVEGKLGGGTFELPGNISSQFITGLLFTLPLLEEDSSIVITTPLESKGYIDLTLQMLERFGIVITNEDYKNFIIKGKQTYQPTNYTVEGDYSQAAFFLVAAALGNPVTSSLLDFNSLQGDKACIELLEQMGAQATYLTTDEMTMTKASLKGITVDARQYPDIIPIMTVALALSEGESRVINGSRLRIKECDRLHAIAEELNKLGADITEHEDSLTIRGVKTLRGGHVHSHHDHRIAMSMAIASTCCEEALVLSAPGCVSKSYPGFFEDFKALGGIYKEGEEVE